MNNLSLISLLKLALKHLYLIVIVAFVFATCTYSYCHFVATPSYSATGSVLVTNGAIITDNVNKLESEYVSGTDITASLSLANTITDVLKINDIYKDLSKQLNNEYTYDQLISRSTISRRSEDTLFIDVTFSASDKNEAVRLVNSYLSLAPSYISKYIPNSTATVTTTADTATKTYPRTMLSTVLMACVGAACTYIVIYLVVTLNNTIQDEDDFKENYEITVIGSIPDFTNAQSKYYYRSYGKGGYTNAK